MIITVTAVVLGLSAPVPRGRKGKKVKAQSAHPVVQDADWLAGCNPDALFQEDSYRKHLKHHCNKYVGRAGGRGPGPSSFSAVCCAHTLFGVSVRLFNCCHCLCTTWLFFLTHDAKPHGSIAVDPWFYIYMEIKDA